MPLHTDYRPKTLEEIVGNKATVSSLSSILNRERKKIPHAYLFHGPSGCGKTTFARIVSNELGCSEHDYIEINAGNNRGIDTARNILKNLRYKPLVGETKVILLDEVHATTKDFQNALLKSLEDTPSHVYFILCTTDPQKLLLTVRNRCMMFEVKKLSEEKLIEILRNVCEKETNKIEHVTLEQIANKADGCPRQALILLDGVIDLGPRERRRAIQSFKTQEEKTIDLCRALLKKDKWLNISKILKGLEDEPEKVRWSVLGYMNSVLLGGNNNVQASITIIMFQEPFYDTGKAGLTLAAYKSINS
jgi:DNA polymerase-3 subunit gamma/tau